MQCIRMAPFVWRVRPLRSKKTNKQSTEDYKQAKALLVPASETAPTGHPLVGAEVGVPAALNDEDESHWCCCFLLIAASVIAIILWMEQYLNR